MNRVLVLLLLATATRTGNISQTIRESWNRDLLLYVSECSCASGAEVTAATNILGKLEYPNDACLKCFIKCLQMKHGLMLSDGTVVPEAWVRVVAGATPQIARNCTNATNHILDVCEKAYSWSQCFVKAVSYN